MLSGPRTALQEWAVGLYGVDGVRVWSEEGKMGLEVEYVSLDDLVDDYQAAKWNFPFPVQLVSKGVYTVTPNV